MLILLIFEGSSRQAISEIEKVIENLPTKFEVKITDAYAYETNISVGVFVRMTWESYARILSTVELEPLLPVIGPSLVRT